MPPRDLEQTVGARLRQLPRPRAPETLLPRVLAAVQAWAQRPWYARAWLTWPAPLQIGSVAAFVVLAGLAAVLFPVVQGFAREIVAPPMARAMTYASALFQSAAAAAQATRLLWRALVEPLASYVFAVVVAICAACAAFATAINRVVIADHAHR